MDAVKFIEERNRMCKASSGSNESSCADCPARYMVCNELNGMTGVTGTDVVNVVEKWSAAHPRKTRQSVFLEQWPNCTKDATGVINLCPRYFDTGYICSGTEMDCAKCRSKFWGKVVE